MTQALHFLISARGAAIGRLPVGVAGAARHVDVLCGNMGGSPSRAHADPQRLWGEGWRVVDDRHEGFYAPLDGFGERVG
jgi:hypothetical protein